MKIFLSAIEDYICDEVLSKGIKMKWNLLSYYQFRKNGQSLFEKTLRNSELMMIDSGAHSFQKGKKVDWLSYTQEYAQWIKSNDSSKIIGFFEMDVDNIIGYDAVLQLRKILESVSDKIIPVWHKNRGISEYKKMCSDHANRVIAITGFRNEDIKDEQYMMFLKEAKKHNCKVHCLGMTRKHILDKVPFDYTDSASWKLQATWGRIDGVKGKLKRQLTRKEWANIFRYSYIEGMKMQEYYYDKWKWYCKD